MKYVNYDESKKTALREVGSYLRSHSPRNRNKSKRKIYDIICTFDTETSLNKPTYIKKQTFAYIILWQFDVDNEVLVYGRSVQSFAEFASYLQNMAKYNLIIYVHNLSYEFQFIKFYFAWDDIFFMDEHKVYRAKTRELIFKDSYALSGQSLAKTVAKYPIKKQVGTWDYKKIRTPKTPLTDTELLYAFDDVISLWYYIDDMRKQWKGLGGIPMTKTGITRKNLKTFLNVYYKKDADAINFKSGYEYYYNNYIKHSAPDLNLYAVLQKSYWGGFTHANLFNSHKSLHDVTSFDICSSYPTVMCSEKYPYKFYPENPERFKYYYERAEDYAIIACYRFINLSSTICMGYIPYNKPVAQTKESLLYDNGKIYKTKAHDISIVDIWLTEQDLITIKNVYTYTDLQIISDKIYIAKKHFLPSGFREFILEMYSRKTTLKDVDGQEENYARAKADLNSLYGMTVTAPIREKWKLDGRETVKYLEDTEENLLAKAYRQKSHPIGLYQWGVYVAAYARRNLMKVIEQIHPYDFIYSDTDSIKTLHGDVYQLTIDNYNREIGEKLKTACKDLTHVTDPKTVKGKRKPLGVYEREWDAKRFKCLRSKAYIYTTWSEKDQCYKLNATLAGISKKVVEKKLHDLASQGSGDPYDYFDDNFEIGADESDKQTTEYIDDPMAAVVEGTVVECESGTVLYDIPFSIWGSDYYLSIMYEVQQTPHIVKKSDL